MRKTLYLIFLIIALCVSEILLFEYLNSEISRLRTELQKEIEETKNLESRIYEIERKISSDFFILSYLSFAEISRHDSIKIPIIIQSSVNDTILLKINDLPAGIEAILNASKIEVSPDKNGYSEITITTRNALPGYYCIVIEGINNFNIKRYDIISIVIGEE